jgi:hypothetical protein
VTSQLSQVRNPATLFQSIPLQQAAIAMNPTPAIVAQGFDQQYGYDLMVSNLGQLAFPQTFGSVQLQALYGPSVFTGYDQECTVGVATLGDRLFLTMATSATTCSAPETSQLLDTAMQELILATQGDSGTHTRRQVTVA